MEKTPQLEDGYVKIANEIYDKLCCFRIPGEVALIINSILRKTYGFNKKEDWISNSQFVEMTGMKKANISRSLSKLITNKIVIKTDNKLRLNKNTEEWVSFEKVIKTDNNKLLSKLIQPVIKTDTTVIKTDGHKRQYTKDNIQKTLRETPFYLKNIPLKDIEEFKNICVATENQIRQKGESFYDYCLSYGKKYKDYKAALRNALRKDYQKISEIDIKYVLSG